MEFKYKNIKKIRKSELKVSRQEFCNMVSNVSNNKIMITIERLARLEHNKPTSFSPHEMSAIFEALGYTADSFYN